MAWRWDRVFGKLAEIQRSLRENGFDAAAENCKMSEAGNPGVIPRNRPACFKKCSGCTAGEGDGFISEKFCNYPQILLKPVIIST